MTNVPENTSYFSFQLLSEVLPPAEVGSFRVDWQGLPWSYFRVLHIHSRLHKFQALTAQRRPLESMLGDESLRNTRLSPLPLLIYSSWS